MKEFDYYAYYPRRAGSNIKYSVNKDKKTCVCYLDDCECDIYSTLTLEEKKLFEAFDIDPRIKNCYVGKAKCADGDVFDEEYGKALARKRMLRKYHWDCAKVYTEISGAINKIFTKFNDKSIYSMLKVREKLDSIKEQVEHNV